VEHCFFTQSEALQIYESCQKALKSSIKDLKEVVQKEEEFRTIGSKMLDIWSLSLDEKTYKEMPLETVRHWS
jgi:serine/threonine-protein kinase HipA